MDITTFEQQGLPNPNVVFTNQNFRDFCNYVSTYEEFNQVQPQGLVDFLKTTLDGPSQQLSIQVVGDLWPFIQHFGFHEQPRADPVQVTRNDSQASMPSLAHSNSMPLPGGENPFFQHPPLQPPAQA